MWFSSKNISAFASGVDELTDKIDLIITMGGDGTLLYASTLFQVSDALSVCSKLPVCLIASPSLASSQIRQTLKFSFVLDVLSMP